MAKRVSYSVAVRAERRTWLNQFAQLLVKVRAATSYSIRHDEEISKALLLGAAALLLSVASAPAADLAVPADGYAAPEAPPVYAAPAAPPVYSAPPVYAAPIYTAPQVVVVQPPVYATPLPAPVYTAPVVSHPIYAYAPGYWHGGWHGHWHRWH